LLGTCYAITYNISEETTYAVLLVDGLYGSSRAGHRVSLEELLYTTDRTNG